MSMRIIISGGGTGGHIFPALSIAREIKKKNPGARLLFVGAKGRMEMEKVPASGFTIIGLPVDGLYRKFTLRNVAVFGKLVISLFKALRILQSFKPDMVIGVGGYASGPILGMAALRGIPFVIQEQNSFAGVTNRLLASRAKRIFVAYEKMEKYFPKHKLLLTGNPVREELTSTNATIQEARTYFNMTPGKPVVVILGGSLGAKTINKSVMDHLDLIESGDVQVLWQTGRLYYDSIAEVLNDKDLHKIKYVDFISRMDLAYLIADVIISRAGAGTISELCCVGKPAILVPSPNVAEDHQTKNAQVLVKKKAALMISNGHASSLVIPEALKLAENKKQKTMLAINCRKMAMPESTRNIVDEIFKIMNAT